MMTRIRVLLLTGVVAVGGSGFAALSAQAQAPRVAAAGPAPRVYYYGPGYNGYGYYYYPAAPTAPTYRGGFYTAPARAPSIARGTTTRRSVQDYTGRHDGLSRPWLRPLQ
jgi:hypothetical protein